MEEVLLLVVMDALNNLGSYKRAFCDYSFQRDHMVKMYRTQCSWIAGIFAKAADEGTVVHLSSIRELSLFYGGTLEHTTSAADSAGGRFGISWTIFFNAASKAWECSNGLFKRPSDSSLLCDRISSRLTLNNFSIYRGVITESILQSSGACLD